VAKSWENLGVQSMAAVRIHRFGGPSVMAIETVDAAEPGEGEAMVRVGAAGVGPWDEAGALRTPVGETLPLPDAHVAHEMLEGARPRKRGKIVLDVGGWGSTGGA
jgi:NADPH:quinone reductase-like Zn-dependent oxidoreductase